MTVDRTWRLTWTDLCLPLDTHRHVSPNPCDICPLICIFSCRGINQDGSLGDPSHGAGEAYPAVHGHRAHRWLYYRGSGAQFLKLIPVSKLKSPEGESGWDIFKTNRCHCYLGPIWTLKLESESRNLFDKWKCSRQDPSRFPNLFVTLWWKVPVICWFSWNLDLNHFKIDF